MQPIVNQNLRRTLLRLSAALLIVGGITITPERERILPERYRKTVIRKNGDVLPTFLLDGFVAGRWTIGVTPKEAVIELLPFKKLARADRAALVAEGERLVRFYAPESRTHGVRA